MSQHLVSFTFSIITKNTTLLRRGKNASVGKSKVLAEQSQGPESGTPEHSKELGVLVCACDHRAGRGLNR